MGLDFIRQRAKTFTRSWDRHRLSLRERTLFSKDPEDSPRTAIARLARELEPGATILVCAEDAGLSAYRGTVVHQGVSCGDRRGRPESDVPIHSSSRELR